MTLPIRSAISPTLSAPSARRTSRSGRSPRSARRPARPPRGSAPGSGSGSSSAGTAFPGTGSCGSPPSRSPASRPTWACFRQELSLFAPIFHDGPDTAAVGLGIRNTIFSTDAILPTSRRPFPDQLWDIEAGLAYAHQWDNGWTTGADVSAGSASDKPFTEGNTLVASLALYTAFPTVGRDAWILGLSYSPTSDFPYPLPIVAYYWEPNENLQIGHRAAFFVRWRFLPEWVLTACGCRSGRSRPRSRGTMRTGGARPYAAFDWSNESYLLGEPAGRPGPFIRTRSGSTAGCSSTCRTELRLDLSAGYVFDRFYFQGKKYADRDRDRVNVGSGPFFAVQLRLQF